MLVDSEGKLKELLNVVFKENKKELQVDTKYGRR